MNSLSKYTNLYLLLLVIFVEVSNITRGGGGGGLVLNSLRKYTIVDLLLPVSFAILPGQVPLLRRRHRPNFQSPPSWFSSFLAFNFF